MEMLGCKSPSIAVNEIWACLLAYNPFRLLMTQAALIADILSRQISFRQTVQLSVAWSQSGNGGSGDEFAGLLVLIAQQRIGKRPGRIERCAIERRPKPFPLLAKSR